MCNEGSKNAIANGDSQMARINSNSITIDFRHSYEELKKIF